MRVNDLLSLSRIYFRRKYPNISKLLPNSNLKLQYWPQKIYGPHPSPPTPIPDSDTRITYIGHRTIYIQTLGISIISDPIFTKRLGYHTLGLKRIFGPPYLYEQIPQANFLLLTNNSYNCLNHTSLDIISARGASNILGGRNITFYIQNDMRNYIYPMDYYDKLQFGELSITFLPCIHKSYKSTLGTIRSLLWHRPMLWGSFLIDTGNKLIYLSGATGYSNHFKELIEQIKPRQLDIAILPIGPIEPSNIYHEYNLTINEAERAREDLDAKITLGIGFDTFPLGLDGFNIISNNLSNKFTILSPGCHINL